MPLKDLERTIRAPVNDEDDLHVAAEPVGELLELVELEVRELLSTYEFDGDNIPVVRVAAFPALNGDAKWGESILELMNAVDEYIPTPERDTEKPFLMPVEDVFTITGRGTVVTGRAERGTLAINSEVEIVGLRPTQKTIVTGIEMFHKQLDEAWAGENCGLLLRGTKREDVERGQVVDHETRFQNQVLRRIAGDRQLAKRNDVAASRLRRVVGLQNLGDVAIKIADGRVHLCQCDAQPCHAFKAISQ